MMAVRLLQEADTRIASVRAVVTITSCCLPAAWSEDEGEVAEDYSMVTNMPTAAAVKIAAVAHPK
jgi:hypothetical protein